MKADATLETAALNPGVITANAMLQSRKKTKLLSKEGRKGEPETPSARGATDKSRCVCNISCLQPEFSLVKTQ